MMTTQASHMRRRGPLLAWLLLVMLLPAAVLAGKKAHKNAQTVEKTLTFSNPSFDCNFPWQSARLYDSCLVKVTLTTDSAFTITSEAENEESNEGVVLYLREAEAKFGSEQMVKFDRMTNNMAGGSHAKRMITIPKEAVKRASDLNIFKADEATYYVLLTKPKKTRTSKPIKITLSKDDYGAKVDSIKLRQIVQFDNKYEQGAFESWHYFQVDTGGVAAPKAIQIHISFNQLIGATYEASDNEYFYRAASPDLFISSRSPALLEVDRYETNAQSGAFAYEAFSGSAWEMNKEGMAMSWHQPEHTVWNKMFVAVRVPMAAKSSFGGRRLMGGAMEPNNEKGAPSTKYTIKVTASRVSSCEVPKGVGSMGVSPGGAKLAHPRLSLSRRRGAHFRVNYPIHPDYIKNKQALLRARMNSANLQLPSGLFSSLPWRRGTCEEDVDRQTWQSLHLPECDLETLYTTPQCKSDCEQMSKCVNFVALACDKLPDAGCTRFYTSVPYAWLGEAVPWGQFFLACIMSFIIGVIVLRAACWVRKKMFKSGCMNAPTLDTDDEGSSDRSDSSSESDWEEDEVVRMPKGRRNAVADICHPENDQGRKKRPATGHPSPMQGHQGQLAGQQVKMTPLAQSKLLPKPTFGKPLTPVTGGWVIGPTTQPMQPAPHLITAGNFERPRQQMVVSNMRFGNQPMQPPEYAAGPLPIPNFRGMPMRPPNAGMVVATPNGQFNGQFDGCARTAAQPPPAAQMVAQPNPLVNPAAGASPTMSARRNPNPNGLPVQMVPNNPSPMMAAAQSMATSPPQPGAAANPTGNPPVATNIPMSNLGGPHQPGM